MKNFVTIIVMSVILFGLNSFSSAQSKQEQKYLNYLTDLIKDQRETISDMEKDLEKERKEQITALEREKRIWQKKLNKKRAKTFEGVSNAAKKIAEIDSVLADARVVYSSLPLDQARQRLAQLEQQRLDYEFQWIKPEDGYIPQEMSSRKKNRWHNSNEVELEEIAIDIVKSNVSTEPSIEPSINYEGLKIILDNKYSRGANFILRGNRPDQNRSYYLDPNTREIKYVLPGIYYVDCYVGGRASFKNQRMEVNLFLKTYGGEDCHGYAYQEK